MVFSPPPRVSGSAQVKRAAERGWSLSSDFWNNQHWFSDHGLFISQSLLMFRSNSYGQRIKHWVELFINAVQTLALEEPFRRKTRLKYQRTRPLISPVFCLFSSLSLHFIPPPPAGEYWQSVRDSADTLGLSYLQAQRRRLRRDSDSEAVSAIASLSMGVLRSDGYRRV